MRSAGAGLFGALLMVAPLVAIPILAVVGIPQFAPATASLDPASVNVELDADLSRDPDDVPGGAPQRSGKNRPGRPSAASDLFDDYATDDATDSGPTNTGDATALDEAVPEAAPRDRNGSGRVRSLLDNEADLAGDPEPRSARDIEPTERLGSDWEVEELDSPAELADDSATHPLPSPRSSPGTSGRSRTLGGEAGRRTAPREPIDVVGGETQDLAPRRQPVNGADAGHRLWANQAPSDRLGEWEAESPSGAGAPRSGSPARRPDQVASADDGPIDFLAPATSQSAPPAVRPAPRTSAGQPSRAAASQPAGNAAAARSNGSSPGNRVRPIPGGAPEVNLGDASENSPADPGGTDGLGEAADESTGPVTRDQLRKQFRDPLGEGSSAPPRKKPARTTEDAVPPVAEFAPSHRDLAAGESLSPVSGEAGSESAPEEESPGDPAVDLGDAGESQVSTATVAEPGTPDDAAPVDSEQLSWTQANKRLKAWGIKTFRVRNTEDGRFVFYCTAPDPHSAQVTRRFEAEADSPLAAVNLAIAEIGEWYQQRTRGGR